MNRRTFIINSLEFLLYQPINNLLGNEPKGKLEKKINLFYSNIKGKLKEKNKNIILIVGNLQELFLLKENKEYLQIQDKYPVSTSKFGFGNEYRSKKTPLGIFKIANKYGTDSKIGTIFKYKINLRRRTKIYKDNSTKNLNFMTTKIIQLKGYEKRNKNTIYRNIYIHGTSNEASIGQPNSHGCIRMKNKDIANLYNKIKKDDFVIIIKKLN